MCHNMYGILVLRHTVCFIQRQSGVGSEMFAQASAVGQIIHPHESEGCVTADGVTDMDFWLQCDLLFLNPLTPVSVHCTDL
jgi:hypothetical protein